jgi:hypothetical protein
MGRPSMKAIRAHFETWRAPPRWAWTLAAAWLSASIALGGWTWHRQRQWQAAQAQAAEQALQREAARTAAQSLPVQPPPYDASAREMLAEREWPWPAALVAIESVAMEGVTATAIEMSAGDRLVHLEVAFADHGKLLTYLEALNAGLDGSTAGGWRWAIQKTQAGGAAAAGAATGQAVLVGRWQ